MAKLVDQLTNFVANSIDVGKIAIQLDDFDHAILDVVQQNNQKTHSEIGSDVGLSNSAVRRRLKALRDRGIIAKDVSVLADDGFGITAIIDVSFVVDTPEASAAFDERMRADDAVKQIYHVSGQTDYVLIVQSPSLAWYEDWAKAALMSDVNLKRHDTRLVYSCKKFETARKTRRPISR